ncbi:hypothetical protein [Xanthobacter oligotrophicus]|uniref:hypothetical protein n=1 Tax=Xanthobacter oligotrophicus TaxID=2607286 RepID=UPI0011F22E8E|nr:hypothetical protein [Xanthobacter oligotrophicus]MCG5233541.1 hypothetical protein [Xanthobacter oligotrophicus]
MARHWQTPLTRPIWLPDGDELSTLADCGRLLTQRFAAGEGGPGLDAAFQALIGAAEAGRPEDVAFAERKVRRFFHVRALL